MSADARRGGARPLGLRLAHGRTAPRYLPIGTAGSAAATAQLEERFEQREEACDVHRYDEATARTAIEGRVVYGAVVVTVRGPSC